jgi:hypothetical protein
MVMGSTKDLHGTDEDDENALTMPTLPERNHKKRTFQLFLFYDGADDPFLQRTTKIFLLIQPRHVMQYMQMETSSLLSCSSAAPLDIDVVIERVRTLARNDQRHRNAACKFATEIIDATTCRCV